MYGVNLPCRLESYLAWPLRRFIAQTFIEDKAREKAFSGYYVLLELHSNASLRTYSKQSRYIIKIFVVYRMLLVVHNDFVRDKRAKFVELANKRVTKCIRELKLVGNLSNKAAYDFTDEDAKKIVKALQKEVDSIRARFADISGASNLDFSL
jgi:hypothetical protein